VVIAIRTGELAQPCCSARPEGRCGVVSVRFACTRIDIFSAGFLMTAFCRP
jgi:hypothetical protein